MPLLPGVKDAGRETDTVTSISVSACCLLLTRALVNGDGRGSRQEQGMPSSSSPCLQGQCRGSTTLPMQDKQAFFMLLTPNPG